ncbi:MAG TPA: hypothetical protein PKC18_12235 [Lacipirellulaceae bacterium]|nr:hypothetical protein [Lacipirellulaceae bacterium]
MRRFFRDRSILIAVIGAGGAIAAAFAKPVADRFLGPAAPPAPHAAAAAPEARFDVTPTPGGIEGAWKQYVLSPDEGDVYLGTFVVSRHRGEYIVSPRTQPEGERLQNTLGVFDVSYDGARWTFNSNWGGGEVGNFSLTRQSPTEFVGEIRVAGRLSNRTRFVKIE